MTLSESQFEQLAWRCLAMERFLSNRNLFVEFAEWSVSSDNYFPLDQETQDYFMRLIKRLHGKEDTTPEVTP